MPPQTHLQTTWDALPDAAKVLVKETHQTLEERRSRPSQSGSTAEAVAIMRNASERFGSLVKDAADRVDAKTKDLRQKVARALADRDAEMMALFREIAARVSASAESFAH